eukprot:6214830-Pleurochrysis_carterae.AAC.7
MRSDARNLNARERRRLKIRRETKKRAKRSSSKGCEGGEAMVDLVGGGGSRASESLLLTGLSSPVLAEHACPLSTPALLCGSAHSTLGATARLPPLTPQRMRVL